MADEENIPASQEGSVRISDPEANAPDETVASAERDAAVEEEVPVDTDAPAERDALVEGDATVEGDSPNVEQDNRSAEVVLDENETIVTSGIEPKSDVKEVLDEEPRRTSETQKSEKLQEKRRDSKVKDVRPLFDSKGSLLETESYAKGRLEELKEKRAAVATLIGDLQAKVMAFKEKENPTDDDVVNLKKYHSQFLEKMGEYEEMTRKVERLMGMPEVPSSQISIQSKAPEKTPPKEPPKALANIEDKLPKIIVCGTDMGDSVPRIIVCEPLNRAHTEPFFDRDQSDKSERPGKGIPLECEGLVKGKLKEAHEAQQKLVAENLEINKMRQNMQQELFAKQELLENMKQQMLAYESENYRIQNENAELQRKLMISRQGPGEGKICKRELYMKFRGQSPEGSHICGTDNTQNLEYELEQMGGDVENIYCQLECMQSEKMALGYSTSPRKPICKRELPQKSTQTDEDKEKDICFETDKDPKYRELKEQYQRLHSDFKNKVSEVASLRVDLEKTRTELDDITILHHELEAMHHKELENNNALLAEKNKMQSSKDRILDLEQMASFARQMYTSSCEELEEMKALIEDQATQLDEYRNKYMKTLQIAEELKKENEFMEIECANKLAVEIQKIKLEMQDHLKELVPIKELLKVTQQKLKETEQMHTIALETVAQLSQKLDTALKELEIAHAQIKTAGVGGEEIANLQHSLEVADKRLTELESENQHLKETMTHLEQLESQKDHQLEEKSHEVQLLLTQLETLREESARQVSRLKERTGTIRKCLQAQVAEMEGELAMCRAETSCANKERDEIRSKLQLEICLLSENFRESQNRILQLQQHVSYLSASHPTAFIDLCK